jgi:hypothetical protein
MAPSLRQRALSGGRAVRQCLSPPGGLSKKRMPRPQRPPRERRGVPVDEVIWTWLLDGERQAGNVDIWSLDAYGDKPNSELRALWADLGAAVVATYVDVHSGKRPRCWWRLEAPEKRRRVGGRGVPESSLLAVVPTFDRGVPTDWCKDDWIWTRDGGTPPEGYEPFEDGDPPRYEAQATYLKRLRLLLPGEARRLRAVDFAPEIIHVVRDDDDDETERSVATPNAVG